MSRKTAFAFIGLIALAMFARPLLRSEVLTFRDHSDYFQPLRYFTAVELRSFRLPFWNPYNASGEPWLANPQTAVFYPPFWIFLIVPFAQAYVIFLLLHLVLLGCGSFLLFSRFASARAAFIGAMTLMLCGPTLSMLDISNNLTTFAWIPLVLWCGLSGASSIACGSAIAMSFLAGEPLFAAIGAVMFALVRRRHLLDISLTAFCLAGVTLVPLGALALVALAAIGFDRIPRFTWLTVAAIVLIIADLVPRIAPLLHSAPFDVHAVPYSLSIGRDGKIARSMQPNRAFDRRVWISGYLNLFERRFDAWTAAPVVSQSYINVYAAAFRRRDVLNSM